MDRRLFLSGLLGLAGTATATSLLPRQAQALATLVPADPSIEGSSVLPKLDLPLDSSEGQLEWDEDVEPISHRRRRRRRRRRRVRRWRRVCRRYWYHGRRRRRCRRRPFWI
ncbi:MAG TPA: hypothetical protein VIB38_11660, partial [Aestuariivirgaceae bacterium]